MAVNFYFDVHVPMAIAEQLRRRGVDVLLAAEDGSAELEDDQLLDRAAGMGRVLFTQDIRFEALAEEWQRNAHPFAGLIFAHQLSGSIGALVRDLELIAFLRTQMSGRAPFSGFHFADLLQSLDFPDIRLTLTTEVNGYVPS